MKRRKQSPQPPARKKTIQAGRKPKKAKKIIYQGGRVLR